MSAEVLSTLMARSIALTPKAELAGKKVSYKVFWTTMAFWTDLDISGYHENAPLIADKLMSEKYWDKHGSVQNNKFTCEDFALRILCEYAAGKGLPVKLKSGVRTYRNMENYSPAEHDRYASNMYGFSEMVMLTYGAPDVQKTGENTLHLASPESLLPGDILAQALDRPGDVAHHVQVVVAADDTRIDIRQGNTSGWSTRPNTTFQRMIGSNMADPQNDGYAGMPIEKGFYEKNMAAWDYHNLTKGSMNKDFLKVFQLYRWNFMEFNK
jgi:hypothetical protein